LAAISSLKLGGQQKNGARAAFSLKIRVSPASMCKVHPLAAIPAFPDGEMIPRALGGILVRKCDDSESVESSRKGAFLE